MMSYITITEAVNGMKNRGYTIDFNLGFNGVHHKRSSIALNPDRFKITEVYRFEGATDPGDQAVVYAIESHDGRKGILVNGYGVSTDAFSDDLIRKLPIRYPSAVSI